MPGGATNIRLRWSREGMECRGRYKHSAPLEPGGDGMPGVLQSFGSAGAGRGWNAGVAPQKEFLGCRAGAATESRPYRVFHCCGRPQLRHDGHKHSAPLEPAMAEPQ